MTLQSAKAWLVRASMRIHDAAREGSSLRGRGSDDRGRLAEKIQRRIVVVLTPLVVAD